ncbi:uroporphyrinogen-III synthase [Kallotenue papyrolyticum]|uniref:uroporphyrinogen-III synthase n=1 Tax=Kallotenue papyrolyticum TaxID=1325125 RepID=UPI000492AA5B|nr:uroporphyrinogen-III synthase [Kallotenue papyrolyticum]
MNELAGYRIALLETRMADELANLIRRYGGTPVCVPVLHEVPCVEAWQIGKLIDLVRAGEVRMVIFSTGVGARLLLESAEQHGYAADCLAALRQTINICRGPKPVAVLRRAGVPIAAVAPTPHTTDELITTLHAWPLQGMGVALLHYGATNLELINALHTQGARLYELWLYRWQPVADEGPVRQLVTALLAGQIDALACTSQVQVRYLLDTAHAMGCDAALIETLNGRVPVAAVGPTCAAALRAAGIEPAVMPTHPKMGQMVQALAHYMDAQRLAAPPEENSHEHNSAR